MIAMVSIKLESSNTSDLIARVYGHNMADAICRARQLAMHHLETDPPYDIYFRDALGGLRGEGRNRGGKIIFKTTA